MTLFMFLAGNQMKRRTKINMFQEKNISLKRINGRNSKPKIVY